MFKLINYTFLHLLIFAREAANPPPPVFFIMPAPPKGFLANKLFAGLLISFVGAGAAAFLSAALGSGFFDYIEGLVAAGVATAALGSGRFFKRLEGAGFFSG